MAFLVDKRVSCTVMCNNPLVNGENHFTASFGGSWFINCNCNFYCSNCSIKFFCCVIIVIMSWAKQSADAGLAGLCEWKGARGVMGEEVDIDIPNVSEEKFIKIVSNSVTVHVHLNHTHVGDIRDVYLQSTF